MIKVRLRILAFFPVLACLLSAVAVAEARPKLSGFGDMHHREVLFYSYQEAPFPALVRLLAAKDRAHFDRRNDSETELLLGELYLSYGQQIEAAAVFERLLDSSTSPEIRDQCLFFLASIAHQRGLPAESQKALNAIRADLPDRHDGERRRLQARLYRESGAFDDAVAVLHEWSPADPWRNYAKFNLGAAMVRSGDLDGGATILNDLGQLEPENEEIAALRDKSNLALGFAYLRGGQPEAAKEPLQRVRLKGPFSNQALLGSGWANAEAENYRRALVPWMELRDRDPFDPAVQEAMLALPYAMVRLNALKQAAGQYSSALETFRVASLEIDIAIDHVRSGRMTAALLREAKNAADKHSVLPGKLANEQGWRSILPVLEADDIQRGIRSLRELTDLQKNLGAWQRSVDVFRRSLSDRELEFEWRWSILQNQLPLARFDDLVHRKLAFDGRLNEIEETQYSLGLATAHEFDLWGEITTIENNRSVGARIPEAEEALDKVLLLKGVLQWTLDEEFDARLLLARQDIARTGEMLASAANLRKQLDDAMRQERQLIAELNSRIDALSPRVDALSARVDSVLIRQRGEVETLLVDRLNAGKRRFDTYAAQARFALAAIYDLGASQVSAGGVSR